MFILFARNHKSKQKPHLKINTHAIKRFFLLSLTNKLPAWRKVVQHEAWMQQWNLHPPFNPLTRGTLSVRVTCVKTSVIAAFDLCFARCAHGQMGNGTAGGLLLHSNVILAPRGCITDKFSPANAINVIIIITGRGTALNALHKCNKNLCALSAGQEII